MLLGTPRLGKCAYQPRSPKYQKELSFRVESIRFPDVSFLTATRAVDMRFKCWCPELKFEAKPSDSRQQLSFTVNLNKGALVWPGLPFLGA